MASSDLAELIKLMERTGKTLSLAESCTGGLVSSMITTVQGVSSFFKGSAVTYSDSSKINVLNVHPKTLERYGAVSAETAKEMAAGAMDVFDSDVSAAVTGFASASALNGDLGLVFIAVCCNGKMSISENRFKGSRKNIQKAAAEKVISDILELFEQENV